MSQISRVIQAHLNRSAVVATEEHREENVSMAHGTLGNAHEAVKEIIDMIRQLPEDVDLEPWVVSKITLAEDYVDTVRDYLKQRIGGQSGSEESEQESRGKSAGSKVVPSINSDEFPNRERQGLEGPFRLRSGLVVYYDPKEGKYYNSRTDMFLSHADAEAHDKRAALKEVDKFTVCDHMLPALIDGDYSGLEDDEERSLRRFEKSLIRQHGGSLNYVVGDAEPEFAHCDVTGLMGNVVTVKVYAHV